MICLSVKWGMIPKHKQILKQKPAPCHPNKSIHARNLCRNCYDKWLKKHNPEYRWNQISNTKNWIENNQEKRKKYFNKWRAKQDPEYIREYKRAKLLEKYGITPDEYKKLFKKQKGKCAICNKKPIKGRNLAIDHCHETGRIRGLLCFRCNFGLSYFSEDAEMLLRASKHIKGTLIL